MEFQPGVRTGDQVTALFDYAKHNGFAVPAVNVTGTNSVNATLEAARTVQSPVVIQVSHAAAHFVAGEELPNDDHSASVAGAVSVARHVHEAAELYGIPVLLHTDHADRSMLPWIDGLLEENRDHHEETGRPLFSSHMLDLSAEPLAQSLETYRTYLDRLSALDLTLEIELGVTGGVEEGFDHTDVDSSRLYTRPADLATAYEELTGIGEKFTVAAAFGNVHGVYNPGSVTLDPEILQRAQQLIRQQFVTSEKPLSFVFHGGSGCTRAEIQEAISNGVVKMNINTDLQWAFWERIKDYYREHEAYLQTQVGNPNGPNEPNKPYYRLPSWLREGERGMAERLERTFEDLNCVERIT